MRIEGFHHLAIQVHDLNAAERFYAGTLGLPVIARHLDEAGALRSIWLELGEGFLALERCAGGPRIAPFRDPAAGLHLLALRIDPAAREAWQRRLAAAGHETVAETRWTFYVRDPEGNRIGFSHHPQERADGGRR